MSNNAPSAQTEIDALKAAIEKNGLRVNDIPTLKALFDALQKLQNQVNDLQNQLGP
jgi:hypothetical protein